MYVCTYTLPLVRKRVLEIMFDARSVDRAVVVPIFGTMSPTRLKRPATSHAHSDSESWVEFFRRQKLLFASFFFLREKTRDDFALTSSALTKGRNSPALRRSTVVNNASVRPSNFFIGRDMVVGSFLWKVFAKSVRASGCARYSGRVRRFFQRGLRSIFLNGRYIKGA